MSHLTVQERRRTFALRQAAALGGRRPRAVAIDELVGRRGVWQRTTRFGALLALAAMAGLLAAQTVHVVSLRAVPALIEWLLPRV
jgi:hypothetical protein